MVHKGRKRPPSCENHPRAKLNWDKVRKIRSMLADGMKQREVAEIMGISQQNVNDINLEHTWKE